MDTAQGYRILGLGILRDPWSGERDFCRTFCPTKSTLLLREFNLSVTGKSQSKGRPGQAHPHARVAADVLRGHQVRRFVRVVISHRRAALLAMHLDSRLLPGPAASLPLPSPSSSPSPSKSGPYRDRYN